MPTGQLFGERSVVSNDNRTATIVTREHTDVLAIPRSAYLKTLQQRHVRADQVPLLSLP